METISASSARPVDYRDFAFVFPHPSGSAKLSEKGMTLTLDPPSMPADGRSTSAATATVYKAGVVDEQVCFDTDGDVTLDVPGPNHCGTKTGPNTWTVMIRSSDTPGIELLAAVTPAPRAEGSGSTPKRSRAREGGQA